MHSLVVGCGTVWVVLLRRLRPPVDCATSVLNVRCDSTWLIMTFDLENSAWGWRECDEVDVVGGTFASLELAQKSYRVAHALVEQFDCLLEAAGYTF